MTNEELRGLGAQWADPRQAEIFDLLKRLVSEGTAAYYMDACRCMQLTPPLRTTVHLVSHLLREIESSIRSVLETLAEKESRVEEGKNHKDEISRILKALEIDEEDKIAQAWLQVAEGRYSVQKLVHRENLRLPREDNARFRETWETMQDILFVVLQRFQPRFNEIVERLDILAKKSKPTRADIKFVHESVPNNYQTYAFFFGCLESPLWLKPLKAKGFFDRPSPPVRDEISGDLMDPPWPQAEYLKRIAQLNDAATQQLVCDTIIAVPDTENPRVVGALAEAAAMLPVRLAAEVVPRAMQWLDIPYQFLVERGLSVLASNLARGGEVSGALEMTRRLLKVVPSSKGLLKGACGRSPEWEYEHILDNVIPDLFASAPIDCLNLLCDILEVSISYSQEDSIRGRADLSYIWRPSIVEKELGFAQDDISNKLVTAICDNAEAAFVGGLMSTENAVKILCDRHYYIFFRLALHAVLKHDPHGDAAKRLVLSGDLFHAEEAAREYGEVLEAVFSHLSEEEQEQVMRFAGEPPHSETWVELIESREGRSPAPEEVSALKERYALEKLAPIKGQLSKPWKKLYGEWMATHGEQKPVANFENSTGAIWVGPTSPVAPEAISEMTPEGLGAYLQEWEPGKDEMAPSREGLGRNLSAVVKASAVAYSLQAGVFLDLHPTYVRALLVGLRDGIGDGAILNWDEVLSLCKWVVEQPGGVREGDGRSRDEDPGWGWTRQATASLLEEGLAGSDSGLSSTHRELVWALLNDLLADPEPTPEYEANYGGDNMDPVTLSINTVRGVAMHAVVRYAVWVARVDRQENDEVRSLETMPEVREILERHLDPEYDSSCAVRAVYGRWLNRLYWLDKEWVIAHKDQIFPKDKSDVQLWRAVWDTYLTYGDVHVEIIEALAPEYEHAIANLGSGKSSVGVRRNPDIRVGDHLVIAYMRGGIDIQNGVLRNFFESASAEIRGGSVAFLGRSLCENGMLGDVFIARAVSFWEWRISVAQSSDNPQEHSNELKAFERWVPSDSLDDEWILDQLQDVLAIVPEFDRAWNVVERICSVGPSYTLKALECLSVLLKSRKGEWALSVKEEDIAQLLRQGLAGEQETATKAKGVTGYLVSKGYHDFRRLLDTDGGSRGPGSGSD